MLRSENYYLGMYSGDENMQQNESSQEGRRTTAVTTADNGSTNAHIAQQRQARAISESFHA
jgi:hypothetical protein